MKFKCCKSCAKDKPTEDFLNEKMARVLKTCAECREKQRLRDLVKHPKPAEVTSNKLAEAMSNTKPPSKFNSSTFITEPQKPSSIHAPNPPYPGRGKIVMRLQRSSNGKEEGRMSESVEMGPASEQLLGAIETTDEDDVAGDRTGVTVRAESGPGGSIR